MTAPLYGVSKEELLWQIDSRRVNEVLTSFVLKIDPLYQQAVAEELRRYGEVSLDSLPGSHHLGLKVREPQKVQQFVERVYSKGIEGVLLVETDVVGELD